MEQTEHTHPVLPDRPRKGRGSVSNRTGRFERETRQAVDDGWDLDEDEALPPLRTHLSVDASRTIITKNESPDIPFDRSINPYKGCEHGCVYCFARPTHAYLGLSPGLDFESKLFFKPNAPDLLRKELSKKGYKVRPIAFGTNTDPYQPVERDKKITRQLLEILRDFNHPFTIVTKSALILRDLDILSEMADKNMVSVHLSVTTLDHKLANKLEPRASTPQKRLEAIHRLAEAGVPVGCMAAPMVPALNDMEMERIFTAARDAGATRANYILLRLPLEITELFEEWLATHVPDRADHVMSLIRQCRDGQTYRSGWGTRFRGTGPYATLMSQRFKLAMRKLGLTPERQENLDCNRFRVPPQAGDQIPLFDTE
ncbi:PA0069 family radical SAM protein [Aestuariispira insulae]|uniref:DNA repair photolyase n=1 Tax=Aestuariispira insulae TaxID=1461337 RepID=A0A3D9HGS5_9PROT|nr:PA0069 family radical SAM protein [Aestuariispira insulae]RED48605.1 DNA repair photolyase [Aestuariispira insulae]